MSNLNPKQVEAVLWALRMLAGNYMSSQKALKYGRLVAAATDNIKNYEELQKMLSEYRTEQST